MKNGFPEKEPKEQGLWEPVVALVVLAGVLAFLLSKSMGNLTRVFVVVMAAILLGGCASTVPGRFTALELDSRSPEQITASQVADTAVYGGAAPRPAESTPRFTEWVALAKVISEFRIRIRLGAVEWGSADAAEAKPK